MPATAVKSQRRTLTLRFTGTRPSQEQIEKRAVEYLSDWDVTKIGPLTVARTRRGTSAFDVRVSYKRSQAGA